MQVLKEQSQSAEPVSSESLSSRGAECSVRDGEQQRATDAAPVAADSAAGEVALVTRTNAVDDKSAAGAGRSSEAAFAFGLSANREAERPTDRVRPADPPAICRHVFSFNYILLKDKWISMRSHFQIFPSSEGFMNQIVCLIGYGNFHILISSLN